MKIGRLFCFALLCFFLVGGICSAAEITTDELNRLDQIFQQLEQNNNAQQEKLQRASALLLQSEKQILQLSERLTKAEQSITAAQNSLQRANESFKRYEQEVKAEIQKNKLQRDVAIVAAIFFAAKK